MDNDKKKKNSENNSEYQFIREKVASKKKRRVKKAVLISVFVVVMAVLFGIISRVVFYWADEPIKKLLGVGTPTPTQSPNRTPDATPTEKPTATTAPTPTREIVKPTVAVDPTIEVTPEPTPVEGEEIGNIGGEFGELVEFAWLENYNKMFTELRAVAGKVEKSLLTVYVVENGIDWLDGTYETETETSGLIVEKEDKRLLLLVNLDRIQSASRIYLTIGKENCDATLWKYDRDYNLAMLSVDVSAVSEAYLSQIEPAAMGESVNLEVGTPILALGNPNGYMGSMELGIVTSRGSVYYITDNSVELFNTNTTDGTDGDGVIANLKGEIVGITTRTMKSGLNETMCTAIGMTKLKHVIKRLASGEEQIYLGVQGEDIPMSVLRDAGLGNGIYVTSVAADSPALEGGIKTGDIILKVDDTEIFSYTGLNSKLTGYKPGDEVTITIQRTVRMDLKQIEVKVVLGSK